MNRFTKLLTAVALVLAATTLIAPAYADDENWTPADGARTVEGEEGTDAVEGEPMPISEPIPSAPAISMKPTNDYVVFSPNDVVENTLIVSNPGSTSYSFKVYAQPYTIDDSNDEYTFSFNTSNNHSDIASWVTFQADDGDFTETTTYRLTPGESKEITYRVSTPATVAAGGQYAAIFAETINEDAATSSINGIFTVSRVALLLYGRSSEGARAESSIADYEVPSFLIHGPISASSRVTSSGNTDVTATFKMFVKGIFGNDLYSNTWAYPVLPGTTRYVNMTWPDTPAFGLYSVEYTVATADQTESHTTIVLIFPIWMMIITILLLTMLGIWITISIKKRKERKSRLIV